MVQKQSVESTKQVDTFALIGATDDNVAGQMLLAKFGEAYNEVMNHLNENEDTFVKGTATLPTVTIIVGTVVDRVNGREKKPRCAEGNMLKHHASGPCGPKCDQTLGETDEASQVRGLNPHFVIFDEATGPDNDAAGSGYQGV